MEELNNNQPKTGATMSDEQISANTAINETEDDSMSERPTASVRLTRSQISGLACIFVSYGIGTSNGPLLGAFYPTLATTKRLSPSQTGFVVGFLAFIGIFIPPFIGKLLSRTSLKYVINSSCFMVAVCAILLGILQWSPPGVTFIALSLAVFSGLGIGIQSLTTVIYVYIATVFPSRFATINGGLSMVDAFGSSISPLAGGFLQEAGGFVVPFAILGGVMLVVCVMILALFSESRTTVEDDMRTVGMFEPLKHIGVCVQLLLLFSAELLNSFNTATLTFHLQKVSPGITAGTVGIIFFANNATGAIASQVAGIMMDRMRRVYVPLLVGLILSVLGFTFCGPSWPITIAPSISTVIVAQIFIGVGFRTTDYSTIFLAFQEAYAAGFPNNKATNSAVSGIVNCVCNTGGTVGAIVGGLLFDHLGYADASAVVVVFTLIIISITLAFTLQRQSLGVKGRDDLVTLISC